MSHHQLYLKNRAQTEFRIWQGLSDVAIGTLLGIHESTVSQ